MLDQVILYAAYIVLAGFWSCSYFNILIPVWLNLIITSTMVVFIGSHRSLGLLVEEKHGGAPSASKETMTTKDVMQFPLVGSCALFGLFVAFKYYKQYATIILSVYFAVVGVFTITNTLAPIVSLAFPSRKTYGRKFLAVPLLGDLDLEFTVAQAISFVPAAIFAKIHFDNKWAMTNNVLGISFCVQAIESLSLGNYRNGAILLLGLFLYDIFWVFYSEGIFGDNVMVEVATNLDEPIKLLFPASLPGNGTAIAEALQLTLKLAKNQTVVDNVLKNFIGKGASCAAILLNVTKTLGQNYGKDPMAKSSPLKAMALAAFKNAKETKLLEPKDYARNCTKVMSNVIRPLKEAVEGKQSLLGLGDIVIPGLFVAILHRFDAVICMATLDGENLATFNKGLRYTSSMFPRPFFYVAIICYALGLAATLWGMSKCQEWYPTGNCAQPALLYLVPACMFASLVVAISRQQFIKLWEYDEEHVSSRDVVEAKKEDKKTKSQ